MILEWTSFISNLILEYTSIIHQKKPRLFNYFIDIVFQNSTHQLIFICLY